MNQSKMTNTDVKRFNRINILKEILQSERISQRELSVKLKISWPTVLQNVNELVEMGLAEEIGAFESTGGRKARAIAPVRNARLALGVDVTKNHISLVLVNLAGEMVGYQRIQHSFSTEDSYFWKLGEWIDSFLENREIFSEPILRERILGVGISVPGIVSSLGDRIEDSHLLNLEKMSIEKFSKAIPFECRLYNDANAAGMAEMRNCLSESAIYLSLSNSVGGAILLNGRLYQGNNQRAGELGHMTLFPEGRECYCGKKGCLDAYCSAAQLSALSNGNLNLFFKALSNGNAEAQMAWKQYLDFLAIAVNNLRMIFDCDIVLGGYIGGYLDSYLDEIRKRLAKLNTFEADGDYLKICRYRLEASALGAALQWIDAFLSQL